ncbi:MAG: ribonuclease P protein component [Rikenellaceae bacterium]
MDKSADLARHERLRSLGVIRTLFESGQSGFIYPIRFLYLKAEEDRAHNATLFSVPKRFHRRANKRNLLRRRLKEALRLNKGLISGRGLNIALIYSTKSEHSYKTIENAVKKILAQMAE